MKRISIWLAIFFGLALLTSCGPTVYVMDLQMRRPSSSGYELGGKSLGVVYVCPTAADTSYAKSFAESFAQTLDEDYFGGESRVDIYTLPYVSGADYSSRDTLVNLVMDTEKDVIFLFDGLSRTGKDGKLYVYDSCGKEDAVKTFSQTATESFLSNWAEEAFFFYNFDSSSQWNKAHSSLEDFKWRKAMDVWMEIAEKNSSATQKSCAAFNIANASYILGDLDLALRWLDMSDKLEKRELSDNLRIRIQNRKEGK